MVLFHALAERVFPGHSAMRQNVIIGLAISVIMQSIMAVIATVNADGFGDMAPFRPAVRLF